MFFECEQGFPFSVVFFNFVGVGVYFFGFAGFAEFFEVCFVLFFVIVDSFFDVVNLQF